MLNWQHVKDFCWSNHRMFRTLIPLMAFQMGVTAFCIHIGSFYNAVFDVIVFPLIDLYLGWPSKWQWARRYRYPISVTCPYDNSGRPKNCMMFMKAHAIEHERDFVATDETITWTFTFVYLDDMILTKLSV